MLKLAYCDWIAHLIHGSLTKNLEVLRNYQTPHLTSVGHPQLDLCEDGSFQSTTKTIVVRDHNNSLYKITVQQIEE